MQVLELINEKEGFMVLTRREEEIIKYASLGFSDKEIASRLRISVRTVNTHMTRIFLKFGAKNRACAVALYLKELIY